MPRLEALDESEYGDLADSFAAVEERLGMVPNSVRIMARRPDITRAWSAMSAAIMGPGNLERGLKTMVGHISSRAAGCNYCMAHTGHAGELAGIPLEKAEALWDFERSPLFDEAERAALAAETQAGRPMSGIRQSQQVMAIGGGQVIEAAGAVVGAIGVSGAPGGEADDACALAGVKAATEVIELHD